MENNPLLPINKDEGWQKGLSLFIQLSGWLVGPIVAALVLGKWLDGRYGTKPWLFLACTGVAFVITCFGLVMETKRYIKEIEKENKKKDGDGKHN